MIENQIGVLIEQAEYANAQLERIADALEALAPKRVEISEPFVITINNPPATELPHSPIPGTIWGM